MHHEQREALDEAVVKIRSGRMTRRSFMERAIALGLASSAAASLLEACGGSSGSSVTTIHWESEHDGSNTYAKLVDMFNKQSKTVHVTYTNGPASTDQLRTKTITMLRARQASTDILSMDIVWPAEFAGNQWTTPITDTQWPTSERAKYLPGPVQGCTFNGKLWAAPLRTDAGLMYYRNDINKNAPTTWDELTDMAKNAQSGKAKYGYLWQGAQYEGLVCDFAEVLYSYGGAILDKNDPTKVTVNSPEATQALTKMVSWIGQISPDAITNYMEEDSRSAWQNGSAAFMRNWPYAYVLGNDPANSKIPNKFGVSALPKGGSSSVGHSVIGGWQLGINAYSKNTDACWEFIKYMLSPEAQKISARDASVAVTLQSVYDDPEVLQKNPLFKDLKPILQNALPRPVSPQYPRLTLAIQQRIHSALTKQVSPTDALTGLNSDLQGIVTAK